MQGGGHVIAMPYAEAATALFERASLVLSESALAMYGDGGKVPEVHDHIPSKRPPFLAWCDPLADMDSTTGGATGAEYAKQFTLHVYLFATHAKFDVARESVQRWVNSLCYGIAADATLGGAVDCAIPRMSDAGYDSTPDKKYVVAAQVDVTCKVFSACPRELKELVRNASRG